MYLPYLVSNIVMALWRSGKAISNHLIDTNQRQKGYFKFEIMSNDICYSSDIKQIFCGKVSQTIHSSEHFVLK